jgi:hypothetical protein
MTKRRILPVAGLVAVAAIALSACSNGSTPGTSSDTAGSTSASPTSAAPASSESSTAPATTESSETTSSAAQTSAAGTEAATAGKVEEKKASSDSAKDPVLEDEVKVTGIATGFTGTGTWATAPGGATYIGVKIQVKAGEKYYNSASCSSFQLGTPDMGVPTSDITSSVKKDLTAAGLAPLESPDPGKTAEGYCMYYVKAPTDTNLTLTYSRLGLKASGKTYPALEKELKITVG